MTCFFFLLPQFIGSKGDNCINWILCYVTILIRVGLSISLLSVWDLLKAWHRHSETSCSPLINRVIFEVMYRRMRNAFGGWFTKSSTRTPPPADPRTPFNVLCFYIFGATTFFNQEILLPAAEDILSGKRLPTATVLVAFVTPLMITKITVPWLVERVSYAVKISIVALSMITGLVLVGAFEDIRVKLIGIALNAVATGAAEMVFLALSSFYSDICISAYVAGTGMASLFSPAYYTGKMYYTVIFCISSGLFFLNWDIGFTIYSWSIPSTPKVSPFFIPPLKLGWGCFNFKVQAWLPRKFKC